MTNTERLIQSLAYAEKAGRDYLTFMVGEYTGNGPSVVSALRRRGYIVTKVPAVGVACYKLQNKRFTNEAEAARSTARVAITHLQAVLGHSSTPADKLAAQNWLVSIGSDPN